MIRIESFSEAGNGHVANEDAVVVRQHPVDPRMTLVCLADGQGGRAGGAVAARRACDTLANVAADTDPHDLMDLASWGTLFRTADLAVAADPTAGLTTLVGFGVTTGRIAGASCGDSDVLVVTDAAAVVLTRGQRKNPSVGSGDAEAVGFEVELPQPWKVLAVSDGVWKYVGWERVIAAARAKSGRDLLAELERAARLPGSGRFQDDFTAVLLELERTTQAGGR